MVLSIEGLDTLVFSGGGVRGLAYIGALMAFRDLYGINASEHFKTFAGTSVGALFALVCAIGASLEDAVALFTSVGLESIFQKDPTHILSTFSLNDGTVLRQLLESILALKKLPKDITIAGLFEITKKRLVIGAVDLHSASALYLDHTNDGSAMPVVKAVLGSMALPPLFAPVHHGPLTLIDGGLLDNFPVHIFDAKKTLGLRTNWYIDPANPMADISAYYTRVLYILQLSMHAMQTSLSGEYPNNVYIDLGPMSAQKIEVDAQDAIFKGYRAAMARFAGHGGATGADGSAPREQPDKYLQRPCSMPAYIAKLNR